MSDEVLVQAGPNGAGKSTLLKMLNGLVKPTGVSSPRVQGILHKRRNVPCKTS